MATAKKTVRGKKTAKKRAGPKTRASKKLASSHSARGKVRKVMSEFKEGKLRSRSKKGPTVKSRKQAIAIALSEAGASKRKPSGKKKIAKKSSR
jgi:hypothetical protein